MTTYTARAERDEAGWWVITVPELPGVVTQAKRLDQIEPLVTDVIRLWLDDPDAKFEIEFEPVGVDVAQQLWLDANAMREHAKQLQRDAVARLTDELGLTVRDAARILAISYQRVAQLAAEAEHGNDENVHDLAAALERSLAKAEAGPRDEAKRVARAGDAGVGRVSARDTAKSKKAPNTGTPRGTRKVG